jgi:hypothetical protein
MSTAKPVAETSQTSETLAVSVKDAGLVDIEITVMQYECILFLTVSAFINCKCTMYTARNLSRSVVEMCLTQIKVPIDRKVLFI